MRPATQAELKAVPLFADLTADELTGLTKVTIVGDYAGGTVLFFEGMQSNILHVILKGRVQIFKKTFDAEVVLNELGAGEYLGEVSLADAQPRSASARTVGDASLAVITKDSFDKLLASNPTVGVKLLRHFFKVLAQRLRRAEQRQLG